MKGISVSSSVRNGRLTRNRKLLNESLGPFEGKDVEISIRQKRKYRSNDQNAYYHAVVVEIVRQALNDSQGRLHSSEETHEFLKNEFCVVQIVNSDGEYKDFPRSTTSLSTGEFMEYLQEIKEWCKEWFNIDIPEPGEVTSLDLR